MTPTAFAPALPHGPLTQVGKDLYLVRGTFRMGPLMTISRTMTVVKTPDGLVVLNAVRLSEAGHAELERLGPVKHLVKLSESHGIDEPFYAERYRPAVWAAPGTRFGPHVRGTDELGARTPIADAVVVAFPGIKGWREVALWLPHGGGTLVTCDALQNHVDTEHCSPVGHFMTSLLGFKGGVIVAPMWRRIQKVKGEALRQAFSEVERLAFENLVTGHGPAVVGAAQTHVREALDRATGRARKSG